MANKLTRALTTIFATAVITLGAGAIYIESEKEPVEFTVENISNENQDSFYDVQTDVGDMEYGGLFNQASFVKLEVGETYRADRVKGPDLFNKYLILSPVKK